MTSWIPSAPDSPLTLIQADREEIIHSIDTVQNCDVVVVGGGIHGAAFARLAALNGLKTVLLERADYGWATSSRTSKMAHGGLRYLEMFDFAQVREGIRAREDLFVTASHLVKPQDFLIPIYEGQSWQRFKMSVGLWLYDLMARSSGRKQSWVPAQNISPNPFTRVSQKLDGAFRYFDGLMRDTRLVIENIVAARQEGALCLNYANVDSVSPLQAGRVWIGWTDVLKGKKHELSTGVVVNCAGPWVARAGRLKPSELNSRIRYSQGTHVLFSKPWHGPALFLPLEEKGRYYWVWPHFAGTMVGTTEREIDLLPEDPQPTAAEVEELLARLNRDIPGSGLDRSSLHYAFAGVRTLLLRKAGGPVSQLSRRHSWSLSNGMLSLVGGKFTTASWTAYEGLCQVYKLAGLSGRPTSVRGRLLPGAASQAEYVSEFQVSARELGIPEDLQQAVIARYGSLVRYFKHFPEWAEPISNVALRGEVEFALRVEQAETLEDILRRRLELEFLSDHGMSAARAVQQILLRHRPLSDVDAQVRHYEERMKALQEILGAKPEFRASAQSFQTGGPTPDAGSF